MGCGASAPVPEAEKPAANQDARNSAPAPIAEDIQAVQDQKLKEPKELVHDRGSLEAGGPDPAPDAQPAAPPGAEDPGAVDCVGDGRGSSPLSPAAVTAASPAEEAQRDQQPATPAPQQQSEDEPVGDADGGAADEVTRLVLISPEEGELERPEVERPTPSRQPQLNPTALDPAVTPSSETATVTLMPEAPAFASRSRYTNESDLSIASTSYDLSARAHADDSDDDELDALFTLQAWKRYYGYNKKKHQDLLTYFWRRFTPKDYSCFCMSYRDQDLFVTSYMAENCINGFCARIEDLGLADSLFLQLYVLHDFKVDQYRIVGLLLVQGQSVLPQLAALSAFDGFVYHKADTSVTLIKQFVSGLLVGKSPLNSLQLISGKEIA